MADEPLQGHIKPSGHINKQFARWEARERGGWQYLARDRREFITLLGGGVSVFLCVSAAAQEGYYGVGHDKWHQGFYSKLKRNDGQGSCCNLMDCRPNQSRMVGDHYEVKVDGAWTPVPYDKINNVVAPDGCARPRSVRDQSQNRQGDWPRCCTDHALARRRGDRMMGWMAPLRHRRAKLVFSRITRNREPSMSEITTIGLDLAKHVFQVHGIDAQGATVLRKRLRRGQVLAFFSRLPRCVVGLEACATAHYWARELGALGHEVRLMPAQYVKAYIKRNKHDAADAEAICEAVVRPTMRFVPVKTADQQAAVLLHRGRERLVRQRTGLVNALRGHLAEFGVIAPQGLRNVDKLIAIVRDERDARLPDLARQVLQVLAAQIEQLEAAVAAIEKQLMAWHKSNPVSQRLASVPGIGPIIATAIAATVVEPSGFRSGREFAAWLGLVPRQNSTGGKHRLGGISKRGNQYLRRLLINGASANLLRSKATNADPWVIGLRRRRPPLVVAVALANH